MWRVNTPPLSKYSPVHLAGFCEGLVKTCHLEVNELLRAYSVMLRFCLKLELYRFAQLSYLDLALIEFQVWFFIQKPKDSASLVHVCIRQRGLSEQGIILMASLNISLMGGSRHHLLRL